MTHVHQYIWIEQTNRPSGTYETGFRDDFGARIGCPLCGEVKIMWADGTIEITTPAHSHVKTKRKTEKT